MVPIVLAEDGGLPVSHDYSRFYCLFLYATLTWSELSELRERLEKRKQ
jgi:hypothetical protein